MLPLADVLSTLDLTQSGDGIFVAEQRDNASHHIVGGHITAQALMAAGRTVPAACRTASTSICCGPATPGTRCRWR